MEIFKDFVLDGISFYITAPEERAGDIKIVMDSDYVQEKDLLTVSLRLAFTENAAAALQRFNPYFQHKVFCRSEAKAFWFSCMAAQQWADAVRDAIKAAVGREEVECDVNCYVRSLIKEGP